MELRRLGALAGIAAGPFFAVAVVIATWLNHDFVADLGWTLTDHGDSAWPSGLAQGPNGWIQVANYAITGGLMLLFSLALRPELERKRSRRTATFFLSVLSLGFLLAAFPEDGPPFGDPTTFVGTMHALGYQAVVIGSVGATIATSVALRGNERWRPYARVSALAAVGVFVFLFVLVFALEVATTLGIYGFFATILGWIGLLALRLRRLSEARPGS